MEAVDAFLSVFEGWKGYILLFFMSLLENLFPPMPGDTFVMAGAVLIGRGKLAFLPVYFSTTAGSLSGFMMMYYAGLKWGRALVQGRMARIFPAGSLDTVEKWVIKYGVWIIALNRFLGGFRAVVSLVAGMAGMNKRLVFILALTSCLLWNALILSAGKWLGENWITVLKHYQQAIVIIISCILILIVVRAVLLKRLNKKSGA